MSEPKRTGLRIRWSKREHDLMFHHDRHRPDGHLMNYFFCFLKSGQERTFVEELEARGFDLTTLKFSILRKPEPPKETTT